MNRRKIFENVSFWDLDLKFLESVGVECYFNLSPVCTSQSYILLSNNIFDPLHFSPWRLFYFCF